MKFSKKEGIGIKRFAVLILSAVILFTAIVPTLPKVSADFENTYVNTGNQIEDLIGVESDAAFSVSGVVLDANGAVLEFIYSEAGRSVRYLNGSWEIMR